MKVPVLVRWIERIEIDAKTGCWNWLGAKHSGYGMVRDGKVVRLAHRWGYEKLVGPVPEGLELDHLCRNPSCVNPCHLEPVTHKENLARSPNTPGNRTHCPQGHPYSQWNTTKSAGRRYCRTCARSRKRKPKAMERAA